MSRGASARLFAAVDPPPEVAEALSAVGAHGRAGGRDRQAPALRVLDPASLHLTLLFLGERPAGEIDALAEAPWATRLQRAQPCELETGAPVWLPPRRPRALAVEVHDPSGELASLQRELARALCAVTGEQPPRRFRAHVTVARSRAVPRAQAPLPATPQLRFEVTEAVLYRSRLEPDGARYESLAAGAASAAGSAETSVRRVLLRRRSRVRSPAGRRTLLQPIRRRVPTPHSPLRRCCIRPGPFGATGTTGAEAGAGRTVPSRLRRTARSRLRRVGFAAFGGPRGRRVVIACAGVSFGAAAAGLRAPASWPCERCLCEWCLAQCFAPACRWCGARQLPWWPALGRAEAAAASAAASAARPARQAGDRLTWAAWCGRGSLIVWSDPTPPYRRAGPGGRPRRWPDGRNDGSVGLSTGFCAAACLPARPAVCAGRGSRGRPNANSCSVRPRA